MQLNAQRAQRGFGLIELLVVVTIIGLLLAFGLPSFSTWGANSRVRTAAEGLQNGLRLAQAEAVRANGTVRIRLTADGTPDASSDADPSGIHWVVLDAGDNVLHVKGAEASAGVTMNPLVADNGAADDDFDGEVAFNGLGRALNLSAALRFEFRGEGSDRNLSVLLTPGGRVRMCDATRTTGDPQACE